MIVSIGADHAGFELKEFIRENINIKGLEFVDRGTHSNQSVDYPDFVKPVAKDVINGTSDFGIVICGSGNGVAMTANKFPEIRAALCWNVEIAQLARQHNNANIIAIPSRFIPQTLALEMAEVFLQTKFEGGRHLRRVEKIHID